MTAASERVRSRQGWRFLLSRRWLSYFVLLTVFAVACGFLSHWQFERRGERVAENQLVIDNYDAAPQPIGEVLPTLDGFHEALEWRPVTLTGHYLTDGQLLAYARPFNGQPGFEILTPFETDQGQIFVVNRGWVPTGQKQDDPDHVPAAPAGEVTVTAHLKPSERSIPGRTAPEGQIGTIHVEDFAEHYGADRTYPNVYGLLQSESPAAETGALKPRPQLDEGNHLSYAFQWILFAVIAAAGLVYGLREEFRERNSDDPRVVRALEREKERRARRRTDADIEDEILDG